MNSVIFLWLPTVFSIYILAVRHVHPFQHLHPNTKHKEQKGVITKVKDVSLYQRNDWWVILLHSHTKNFLNFYHNMSSSYFWGTCGEWTHSEVPVGPGEGDKQFWLSFFVFSLWIEGSQKMLMLPQNKYCMHVINVNKYCSLWALWRKLTHFAYWNIYGDHFSQQQAVTAIFILSFKVNWYAFKINVENCLRF